MSANTLPPALVPLGRGLSGTEVTGNSCRVGVYTDCFTDNGLGFAWWCFSHNVYCNAGTGTYIDSAYAECQIASPCAPCFPNSACGSGQTDLSAPVTAPIVTPMVTPIASPVVAPTAAPVAQPVATSVEDDTEGASGTVIGIGAFFGVMAIVGAIFFATKKKSGPQLAYAGQMDSYKDQYPQEGHTSQQLWSQQMMQAPAAAFNTVRQSLGFNRKLPTGTPYTAPIPQVQQGHPQQQSTSLTDFL